MLSHAGHPRQQNQRKQALGQLCYTSVVMQSGFAGFGVAIFMPITRCSGKRRPLVHTAAPAVGFMRGSFRAFRRGKGF
jgi:hypothetical protein